MSFCSPVCCFVPPLGPFLNFFFLPFAANATFSSSSLLWDVLPCTYPLRVSSYMKSSQRWCHVDICSQTIRESTKTNHGFFIPFSDVWTNSTSNTLYPTTPSSYRTCVILVIYDTMFSPLFILVLFSFSLNTIFRFSLELWERFVKVVHIWWA